MTRAAWDRVHKWWSGNWRDRLPTEAPVLEKSTTREVITPHPQLCAITELGIGRDTNEDAFRLSEDHRLWVIGDGMGGQRAGEIASLISVETVVEAMASTQQQKELLGISPELQLPRAFALANQRVLMRGKVD